MILLELTRGVGGVGLFVQDTVADLNVQATDTIISIVGVFLFLWGLALVVVAIGIFRRLHV